MTISFSFKDSAQDFLRRHFGIVAVTVSWAFAVAGRLARPGYAYGLNYSLFQPDGENYAELTSDLLSGSIEQSTVYSWTRPLYSILSVPFYAALQEPGMLVIPALSYLVVGLALNALGKSLGIEVIATGSFVIMTMSVTFNRWMIANLTDALHVALFALMCLALAKNASNKILWSLLLAGVLARPMQPVWSALLVPFALRLSGSLARSRWLMVMFSMLTFILSFFVMKLLGGFGSSPQGTFAWLLQFPMNLGIVTVVELGQLAVLDRILLVYFLYSTIVAIRSRKDVWSQCHLLVTGACFVLGGWIGVLGVNFRYQLPALITGAIVIGRQFTSVEGNVRSPK